MKRWATHLFIAGYLGVLGFGVFAHALSFLKTCHPAMYFIVWDMYCGWSAYETRLHVLGEGASGRYYELAPGPWGELHPFGSCGRQHYDHAALFVHRLAANTLAHTEHEPVHRILVFEESWPKKFNLPERVWALQYDEPKQPHSYFHLRSVYNGEGRLLQRQNNWLSTQYQLAVLNNPRLRSNLRKGHTFIASHPSAPSGSGVVPAGYESAAPAEAED